MYLYYHSRHLYANWIRVISKIEGVDWWDITPAHPTLKFKNSIRHSTVRHLYGFVWLSWALNFQNFPWADKPSLTIFFLHLGDVNQSTEAAPHVQIPLIDIPKILKYGNLTYELRGVCSYHKGHGRLRTSVGHYTVYCKRGAKCWELYDDLKSKSASVKDNSVVSCEMIVYIISSIYNLKNFKIYFTFDPSCVNVLYIHKELFIILLFIFV
jgi:hypothetical protein